MFNANQLEMELKIRELTYIDEPSPLFVHTLWLKMKKQNPQVRRISDPKVIHWRPVWIILLALVIVLSALFIGFGPQKVYGFIQSLFTVEDPGLQIVKKAGLVTYLDLAPESENLTTDSQIDKIEVMLDWVYGDEGRLVMELSTSSVPSDLTFDFPTLSVNGILDPISFSPNGGIGISPNKIRITLYNPILLEHPGEEIDFSFDLNLIKTEDQSKKPLAVYHFDIQGFPIYQGIPFQIEYSFIEKDFQIMDAPIRKGGIDKVMETFITTRENFEFQINSIKVMPSFTDVTYCTNLSPMELISLPKADIMLQINNGAELYQFVLKGFEIEGNQTCGILGFRTGSVTEVENLRFRFKSEVFELP